MFESIIKACRYLLCNYPGAEAVREYLDSRVKPETQEIFQFGYFPPIEELHLLTDLVGEEILLKRKLMYHKDIEDSLCPRVVNFCHFDNYPLVMPFQDAYGSTGGLVGRTLLSAEEMKKKKIAKYKNTSDFRKGNYLYGLYQNKQHIIDQNSVYIVEGQFDVIKAMERGIRNIVAIGNNNITSYQFSVISRYASNIIMLLDNDEAGVKGRKSAISKFGKFANIQNFYIPESYKDIDEYLTQCDDESPSFIVKD
jgi:DNA primase catalytic core